ncbi:arylsulfatase B-like isoform X1 [Lytechinus pictus]|uniref:arylsulfatase B-like isoform X1 n=1 Tax=Lytechinus pictus TaxID=7653 RepID=UPI0030BA2155
MDSLLFIAIFLLIFSNFSILNALPPNIVFILADDYGYHDVGYHNNNVIKTPNLDALASAGVKLENYYVQPICTPTRSQLLSGKYQIHTGLQHGIIWPDQPNCLPLDDPTVADKLTEAGYESHITGKWHLGFYKKACWPTNRGFKSFLGYLTGSEDYYNHTRGYPFSGQHWFGLDFRDNLDPASNYTATYSTHVFAQRAQQIIQQHDKQKPLFLYIPFQAVHGPLQVPDSYVEPYKFIKNGNRRNYAGMTTCMDEAVGNITATLKTEGLWNNTILIFSTDNGGQVYAGGNNWPLRGWKASLWEGGMHGVGFVSSPLLPEEVKGTVNRELIHVSDWYPTLVEGIAGWNLEGTKLDGFNVWKTISELDSPSPRVELLHNIDPMGPGDIPPIMDNPYPPMLDNPNPKPIPDCNFTFPTQFNVSIRAAIRYKDWKLITGNPGPGNWIPPPESGLSPVVPIVPEGKCVWLFNIKDDPNEVQDRSDEEGVVLQFLLNRLYELQQGALPVNYPKPDARSNPALHNNTWDSWE